MLLQINSNINLSLILFLENPKIFAHTYGRFVKVYRHNKSSNKWEDLSKFVFNNFIPDENIFRNTKLLKISNHVKRNYSSHRLE